MTEPMTPATGDSSSGPLQSALPEGLAQSLRKEARRFGLTALLASAVLILGVFAVSMTKAVQNPPLLSGLALVVLSGLLGVGFSKSLQGLAAVAARLDSLETRLDDTRLRISAALDTQSSSYLKPQRLAEIRIALRNGDWDDAETLVRMFEEGHPDDPEAARISQELVAAQQRSSQETLSKIKIAREANDPDRVIELRESIKPVLKGEPLRDLDRELGRWFINLIQKRLRSGTAGVDIAILAGRVAGVLDETAEGASLRASLPTLRRAASLCPKCAQPYKGIADACPACVAQTLAHHNASKSKSSGTIAAYPLPKTSPSTETVD